MTFSNYLLAGAAVAVAISLGVATHRLDNLRSDNATLRRDLQSQTQARNTAEWLLQSQMQAMQFFPLSGPQTSLPVPQMRINAMTQNKKSPLQRLAIAVTALCLPLLLASCKSSNALPVPPVVLSPQIDAELLAPTPVPVMPVPFLWRSSLLWNADLLTALGQCNRDKAAARQQDEQRKQIYGRPDPGAGQPAP
ncbi:hypothetical protein QNH14_02405 [Apirhabdus apintestini]|nr:hypothetical protein QNH14_02405 [Enterobacteriaceae bacterium CA-0114]